MRIDRAYKGVTEPELILFDNGMGAGPNLQVGEQYLMYTRRLDEADVPSRGCTRSRHVKYAEEDLKYLNGLSEAAPTARVFGQVGLWPEGPGNKQLVTGAVVSLHGPEETLTATTDDQGRYSFDGLKSGKYSVSADRPGFRMPSPNYDRFAAEVEARGCAVIDVELFRDWPGTISGRLIRPDNTPAAAGIDLKLLRIGEVVASIPGEEVETDDRGEYMFRGVAPGRYKVVLHWCCFPTPAAPYPPIYWPAASTEEEAAEILIGNTVVPQHYDFRLPPAVNNKVVRGLVLLPNGKPAESARVMVLKLPENAITGEDLITDAAGHFSFTPMEGLEYSLTATSKEEDLTSETLPYSFSKGPHSLTLVMAVPGALKDPR
jgi:hypothetical protein